MDWIRCEELGRGSFAKVNLAVPRSSAPPGFPPLMAAKSCDVSLSSSLMNEKSVLDELQGCPQIIRCFGDSFSDENGEKLYNVLLEYAAGGSLADRLSNSDDRRLPESEIRKYTKALLKGLHYIHKLGYVHCDIKLQNILLCSNGGVKIADFGLAKRDGGRKGSSPRWEFRGTPLYMSPEAVAGGEQGAPADIWALGCVVAEMVTGTPAWKCSDIAGLLLRIGVGEEVPEVPKSLSEQGKDFVAKCFVKDPAKRWTAEMLLNHPFVAGDQDSDEIRGNAEIKDAISPRSPFDFTFSQSCVTSSTTSLSITSPGSESWTVFPAERLQGILSDGNADDRWSVSDDWITVR